MPQELKLSTMQERLNAPILRGQNRVMLPDFNMVTDKAPPFNLTVSSSELDPSSDRSSMLESESEFQRCSAPPQSKPAMEALSNEAKEHDSSSERENDSRAEAGSDTGGEHVDAPEEVRSDIEVRSSNVAQSVSVECSTNRQEQKAFEQVVNGGNSAALATSKDVGQDPNSIEMECELAKQTNGQESVMDKKECPSTTFIVEYRPELSGSRITVSLQKNPSPSPSDRKDRTFTLGSAPLNTTYIVHRTGPESNTRMKCELARGNRARSSSIEEHRTSVPVEGGRNFEGPRLSKTFTVKRQLSSKSKNISSDLSENSIAMKPSTLKGSFGLSSMLEPEGVKPAVCESEFRFSNESGRVVSCKTLERRCASLLRHQCFDSHHPASVTSPTLKENRCHPLDRMTSTPNSDESSNVWLQGTTNQAPFSQYRKSASLAKCFITSGRSSTPDRTATTRALSQRVDESVTSHDVGLYLARSQALLMTESSYKSPSVTLEITRAVGMEQNKRLSFSATSSSTVRIAQKPPAPLISNRHPSRPVSTTSVPGGDRDDSTETNTRRNGCCEESTFNSVAASAPTVKLAPPVTPNLPTAFDANIASRSNVSRKSLSEGDLQTISGLDGAMVRKGKKEEQSLVPKKAKIMHPAPTNELTTLRRSSRNRMAPCRHYLCERPIYRFDDRGDPVLVGTSAAHISDPFWIRNDITLPKVTAERQKQHTKRNAARRTKSTSGKNRKKQVVKEPQEKQKR
ncbi:hypothetical protein Tcan_17417 [Toxocara canis]|uniref:Uncharacterized protein n=1 Tax=Toxocara canis TaxID=6265 RepID=A0A0B2VWL7_TOXCA|nr:hypothetical protein Tcan_17417 [Toxocara canis]